uniref:Uncharacterized protein n=1 Tax=Aegilops tauschii subsp. strangulata TaxID=200361 RepID=A0A453BID2_AEGTS
MFETEAKKLIKQSARFLIDRDDYDIHEQAEKIQKICGQRLIFQFRLNDYNFKYGYQDYTVHRIFFIDPEEDSAVQHANVEQNPTKGTKKARTRNTCRVVHSDEESEEDSQEKDECKFKESSLKIKSTISIIEDGDLEKDGTLNYSKTSIRLTAVDKGSKKKGIQNDNHEQVKKLSLPKNIKQEPEDDELTIDQIKRGRRRSTVCVAHLDDESKAKASQEINKSKSIESSPKRKCVVTRKCVGVDQENNDSKPRTRLSCVVM